MKILLIYPYFLEERPDYEDVSVVPIGVYYVGAVLKKHNYDVEVLNWHNINKRPEKIKQTLSEKNPDIIGFSVLHANRWGAIEISRIAKKIIPYVKIVFGGIGATFLWNHFLTHFPEIDFIVCGEGEYTFLNLVKCLEQKNYQDIGNLKGIAFRKKGCVLKNPDAELIANLDELPNPAQFFDYQHLSLTRGCFGKCRFCGSPHFWGPKVRSHSAKYFVDQLEMLYEKKITFFYVSDDTFTIHKGRVIEVCRLILDRKLKLTWAAVSRVDTVDKDLLYWMRKAGCIQISYGVESGSEKIREFLNKKISHDRIKNAFALTTMYGIMARAYFIYGSPGESMSTIQETIDLIQEIKPFSCMFYILDIFPGTSLYKEYKKIFNVTDDIWLRRVEDIMYFETDPDLSAGLISEFGKKLRNCFYENLPGFALGVELADIKEFYPLHSDFCSRLGMTFDHGDYAHIKGIPEKGKVAEQLYRKSLEYYPDQRAYLGLGIMAQKQGASHESIKILSKGIEHFPDNVELNLCISVSFMNIGEYKKALDYVLKFPQSEYAHELMSRCYKALQKTA
jgi:anaerobic magnesium-protoporphyrin IX monomethyl ester cyclase